MRLSLFRPAAIQHPWDLHKCRALAHVWLLGRVEWERVSSSDVLMRRLRLTRCCGYMSVPRNWWGLGEASLFFCGSCAKVADKCHPNPAAVVRLTYLFINFVPHISAQAPCPTDSYQFTDSEDATLMFLPFFLSRYEQVTCRVSLTLTLSGNSKQTIKQTCWLKMEQRQDITLSKSLISPIEVSAVHSLNSKRRACVCTRFTFVFPPSHLRSCSDRIISAREHFASPKLIRSSSFVFTSFSCHRSRRQSVLMSNWAQLLACFTLMMHSEQRKAFFFRFLIMTFFFYLLGHIEEGFRSWNILFVFVAPGFVIFCINIIFCVSIYLSLSSISVLIRERRQRLWVNLLSSPNQWNCESWNINTFRDIYFLLHRFTAELPDGTFVKYNIWPGDLLLLVVYAVLRCLLCADEATGYGPVFEEQPVETIYPEESPEAKITMSCRARASPPATYT